MSQLLLDKYILITGGTSRLGQAFVRKAVNEGAKVFFTYFESVETARELEKLGAKRFQLNILDSKNVEDFSGEFIKNPGRLDVLIHNAAVIRDHTIQNLSEKDWDEVLEADLKTPYFLTKKLLRLLFKKSEIPGRKKIFFITSRAAIQGGFGVSNYAAAKAGLIALAKSLAAELGRKEILVNAVNPGFMKSKMTENLPEAVTQRNLSASPLEEYSNPDEVADYLTYLCSNAMSQVTGQVLHFESRKM